MPAAVLLALFVGFAASAIGFTAWPLIVPLLFVFRGFDVYLTLFISLLVDGANALIMVWLGCRGRLVDVRLGLLLAGFALLWVAVGFRVGSAFIPGNEDMFRGVAGLASMAFGALFLLRGLRRRRRKASGLHRKNPLQGSRQYRKGLSRGRTLLILPGVALVGFQVGLLGIGGGMGYAVFLMACLAYSTTTATGTAMLISFISVSFAACAMFLHIPEGSFAHMKHPGLVPLFVLASMLGTWLGAGLSYSLKEEHLNYMIGAVVLLAGLLATLQKYWLELG